MVGRPQWRVRCCFMRCAPHANAFNGAGGGIVRVAIVPSEMQLPTGVSINHWHMPCIAKVESVRITTIHSPIGVCNMTRSSGQYRVGTAMRIAALTLTAMQIAACGRGGDKPLPPQMPPRPQTMEMKNLPLLKKAVLHYSMPASTRHPASPTKAVIAEQT